MFDAYSRRIDYLRVSVTDRCNLRCRYCMPEDGIVRMPRAEILSIEEIETVVAYAIRHGLTKIRLTGGEPLVRRGIVTLVEKIARIPELKDFGMTTNGILLKRFAPLLRRAGLHRLNVSLDTTDPAEYNRLTRGGNVTEVLEGIDAARAAGFHDIKLNCVIENSVEEKNAKSVRAFAEANGLTLRYIRCMNTALGTFWSVIGGQGGNCTQCNRLRLSADGRIYPCLFSDVAFSVRRLGIVEAISSALRHKPECGAVSQNRFYRIGG